MPMIAPAPMVEPTVWGVQMIAPAQILLFELRVVRVGAGRVLGVPREHVREVGRRGVEGLLRDERLAFQLAGNQGTSLECLLPFR